MNIPKYKLFVKAENKIYNNMSYLGFDYTRNEIEAKIRIFSYNDSDNILLPYWRTVHGKDGDFDLYQGDVFLLVFDNKDNEKYIVSYDDQYACFTLTYIDENEDEIFRLFMPNPNWWFENQCRMSYLGNEHINPELLEEK